MKTEETAEEAIHRFEQDIQEINQQLAEKTISLEKAKQELSKKEKELELAKQVSGDIQTFSKALEELKGEIEESKKEDKRKEKEIKQKIIDNKWVLGLDCQVKAKEQKIDIQTALDLHVKTNMGEDRVFEFKSPNLDPFTKKKEDGRLYITPELSEGINQLIDYMKKTDIYHNIDEPGTYKINKPAGVIVIGYKLPPEQEKLLENWNFHLKPHIRIVTYDNLLNSATQNLENIRCVRNEKKE